MGGCRLALPHETGFMGTPPIRIWWRAASPKESEKSYAASLSGALETIVFCLDSDGGIWPFYEILVTDENNRQLARITP